MSRYVSVAFRVAPATTFPAGIDRETVAEGFSRVALVSPGLMRHILRRLFEEGLADPDARPLLCLTARPKDGPAHAFEGVRTSCWGTFSSDGPTRETLGTTMRDAIDGATVFRCFTHAVADVTELMVTYDAEAPPEVIAEVTRPARHGLVNGGEYGL